MKGGIREKEERRKRGVSLREEGEGIYRSPKITNVFRNAEMRVEFEKKNTHTGV